MIRTRHALEALLMARSSLRRPSRRPGAVQLTLGLLAFVTLAASVLYLATVLGR